jgi:hypothetical protein
VEGGGALSAPSPCQPASRPVIPSRPRDARRAPLPACPPIRAARAGAGERVEGGRALSAPSPCQPASRPVIPSRPRDARRVPPSHPPYARFCAASSPHPPPPELGGGGKQARPPVAAVAWQRPAARTARTLDGWGRRCSLLGAQAAGGGARWLLFGGQSTAPEAPLSGPPWRPGTH